MRIIFFDGHCNLCNGFVDWLIRHDHEKIFQYSSLQGKKIGEFKLPAPLANQDTVIYFRYGVFYSKAQAVVNILEDLGGRWAIIGSIISLMPNSMSNFFYDILARFRYFFFGHSQSCRVPTLKEKERFLD